LALPKTLNCLFYAQPGGQKTAMFVLPAPANLPLDLIFSSHVIL